MVIYILTNFPVNTYLLIAILFGQFPLITRLILINLLVIQYFVLIFFHLLAAAYSSRIHCCAKRLFHWSAQASYRYFVTLQNRLKVWLYIEKFNTANRYGITYGPYGLMSFHSFSKVCVLGRGFEQLRD